MTEQKSKDKDDVSLSTDPFSEDHEITMMEKMSINCDIDTLDETNEITEKSFASDSLPSVSKAKPATPKNQVPKRSATTPHLKRIALIVTLPVALILFPAILYFFNVLLPELTKPTKPPVTVAKNQQFSQDLEKLFGPQDHNIQLSEITTDDANVKAGNLPSVYIGDSLKVNFSLINWQIPPKKPILNFHVALKIFDSYGKTLMSLPHYKTYSEHAVAKEESLLIENTIRVLPNTPVGVYDVRFDVIDDSSQKAKTLQTRFRVLSRQPQNQ